LVAGAEDALSRLVGPLPPALLEEGLVATGRRLAALGLTAIADATPRTHAALALLRRLMGAGSFPLRVYAMRPPGSAPWPSAGGTAWSTWPRARLRSSRRSRPWASSS